MLVEYKKILKECGITGVQMAEILNMKYGSYKYATRKSATTVPRWVCSFVVAYKLKENE